MGDEERYGIAELAEAAGVSVRTVRYYIAEGLLPPPVAAGARSHYSREHLDRLRLIGRLKDAFLPLREIRRHLAGLDETAIRQLTEEGEAEAAFGLSEEQPVYPAAPAPMGPSPAPPAMVQEAEPFFSAQLAEPESAPRRSSASEYIARLLAPRERGHSPAAHAARRPVPRPHHPPRLGMLPGSAPEPEPVAWRRIAIGEEAELLVREEVYQRRRDKIDWLIEWARKVLG